MKILYLMCLRRREGKEVEDEAGKSEPAATANINSVRKYLIKFMLMIAQ
jgi:hypothetical protein